MGKFWCSLKLKGVYYLFKGAKAFIASVVNMIKVIANWSHNQKLKKPGESTWDKIQEVSDGNAMIVKIPVEMFELTETDKKGNKISPFDKYMQENGLRYCKMPDFNPYDDYVPVGIVSQDYAIHQAHIKEYMNLRIKNQKENGENYDAKITEAKQRLANARSDKERKEIEDEIAALVQAKEENAELLKESEEKLSHGNKLEFEEYMKTCDLKDNKF